MESSGPRFERRPDEADTLTDDDSLGKLVTQVSENASALIREEIELAKAEVEEKVRRLAMGAVVAAVAGFFILIGLIFVFQTIAWGISDAFFPNDIWAGFLITTLLLFALAALGGFIAYRSFQAGAPPVPDQAIEEAKLIREALEHPDVQAAAAAPQPATAQQPTPTPTPPTPEPAAAPDSAPRPSQAEKAAAQAEKKQAKQAAKEAKAAEKRAAEEAKAAEKQAAKARREAEKQAAKAEVEATKARREAQKQADKAAAEADKAKREAEQQAEKARKAADKQAAKDAKKKNKERDS